MLLTSECANNRVTSKVTIELLWVYSLKTAPIVGLGSLVYPSSADAEDRDGFDNMAALDVFPFCFLN